MKKLLFISLMLYGCGSEKDLKTSVDPTPTPSPSASPAPQVSKCDSAFLGDWLSKTNTLQFNDDCTALVNTQRLTWSLQDKSIEFSSDKLSIDTCAYQIVSQGGLIAPITITLNLICDKSGVITYLKK